MIQRLENDNAVQMAALIAATFHIDPVQVLNGSYFEFSLRQAAYNYYCEQREKAAKEAESKRKKK